MKPNGLAGEQMLKRGDSGSAAEEESAFCRRNHGASKHGNCQEPKKPSCMASPSWC
jgi:hypothetical protein